MIYEVKNLSELTTKELENGINQVEKDIAIEYLMGQVSGSQIRLRASLYHIANERGLHKQFYDQVVLVPNEDIEDEDGWVCLKMEQKGQND